MILAGLTLLTIGTADIVRQSMTPVARRVVLGLVAVAVLALGTLAGAWPAALAAWALTAAWMWSMPIGRRPRLYGWPILVLAFLCLTAVAVDATVGSGVPGSDGLIASPWGSLSLADSILIVGVVAFLFESANVVVRVVLSRRPGSEAVSTRPRDERDPSGAERAAHTVAPLDTVPDLKGGRLIGPLERILVFALTFTAAYGLIAGFVAAKGIVRFPEISSDRGTGNRAEYFLVGSTVSWVLALGAALLVWWAVAPAR